MVKYASSPICAMNFDNYCSENKHCILVENVRTIDEKQIELFVLFGPLAYVNYCYISQNYYFLVYMDCRDAKRALPCISKMSMLNGISGKRVSTRYASLGEIAVKCDDPQLHTRLSPSIIVRYFQGHSRNNLNHMDIRILHNSYGEVSHVDWLSADCLKVSYFNIACKVKALSRLLDDYTEMGIPVSVQDAAEPKNMYNHYHQSLLSPTSTTSAASNNSFESLMSPMSLNMHSSQISRSSVSSSTYLTPSVDPILEYNFDNEYIPGPANSGPPSTSFRNRTKPKRAPKLVKPKVQTMSNTHKRNQVCIPSMLNSGDKRSTLMLKNIPNRYTQKMMIEFLNETHFGEYDFLYLRMDYEVIDA
eukprot:NODE_222_length_13951_cov_0.396982.p4 type:complete len:361 gc:universal NODE_222_length_13951_cov_0.396982:6007-7089(+)